MLPASLCCCRAPGPAHPSMPVLATMGPPKQQRLSIHIKFTVSKTSCSVCCVFKLCLVCQIPCLYVSLASALLAQVSRASNRAAADVPGHADLPPGRLGARSTCLPACGVSISQPGSVVLNCALCSAAAVARHPHLQVCFSCLLSYPLRSWSQLACVLMMIIAMITMKIHISSAH